MNTPCFFHFPKNVFLRRRKLGEPHVEMALNFKSSTRWEHTAQWARTWEKVWFKMRVFGWLHDSLKKLKSTCFEIFSHSTHFVTSVLFEVHFTKKKILAFEALYPNYTFFFALAHCAEQDCWWHMNLCKNQHHLCIIQGEWMR